MFRAVFLMGVFFASQAYAEEPAEVAPEAPGAAAVPTSGTTTASPDANDKPNGFVAEPTAAVGTPPPQVGAISRRSNGIRAEPTAPAAATDLFRAFTTRVSLLGYAKMGYFWVTPGSGDALVGSRNGFRMMNMRVGADIRATETFDVVATIEGGVPQRSVNDAIEGRRIVELRDAFIRWAPMPFLQFRLGQFKAPYNAETLLGDGELPFIRRSVVTEGINPPEGYTQEGLSLDRQVGLEVGGARVGNSWFGFRYAAAIVNGNGANNLFNDNNAVTPVGRVVFDFAQKVSLGLNASYNYQTTGERPNRLSENRLSFGADVGVQMGGFNVLLMALARHTSSADAVAAFPAERGLGFVGSVGYFHAPWGLEAGLRGAWLEPSHAQTQDRLVELAAEIGWRSRTVPARVMAQFTKRIEESGIEVANDSLDLLVQVNF